MADKPPASRAADRRILIYFGEPSTREQLDALAAEDGVTRSQMIAQLVEQEASRRSRKIKLAHYQNRRPAMTSKTPTLAQLRKMAKEAAK